MSDTLIIKDRKGQEIGKVTCNLNSVDFTVKMLKKEIMKIKKVNVYRQWLTIGPDNNKVNLDDLGRTVKSYNIQSGSEITMKDIGPQIGWDTVFYIEYFGPILTYGIMYFIGSHKKMHWAQNFGLYLGVAHFVKRLLETKFVHVFSRETMPLTNLYKNCFHYWILFGAAVGCEFFNFWKDPGYSKTTYYIIAAFFGLFEFMNFMCHKTLSNIRTTAVDNPEIGSANKKRDMPKGWGFGLVSCANYFWEFMSWVAFSLFSRCYTSYLFTAVSFYQMFVWALQKHKRYQKEFGDKYKGRKAMIPFLL